MVDRTCDPAKHETFPPDMFQVTTCEIDVITCEIHVIQVILEHGTLVRV